MKNRLYILLTVALLSAPALQALDAPSGGPTAHRDLDYKKAFDLMKDFLNLNKKPDKSINYWAKQFILLIQMKDKENIKKLAPFLRDFRAAHKMRNAFALGMAFKSHKDKFNEPELAAYLTEKIQRDGLDSLLKIMKQRMKK